MPQALSPTRRLAIAAVAVSTGAVLSAVAVTGPAAASTGRSSTAQPWVAARSVCAQPTSATAVRCFAEKLVTVPAHTPGARPRSATAVGHGPGGGLSPADLGTFYGYNPKTKVTITVGIVMWGNHPNVRANLNRFDAQYGLPKETSTSFRVVNQAGVATPLPLNNPDTYPEISLDTQAVRAVCNSCRILLVEASVDKHGNPSDAGLAAAENTAVRLGAGVVSNSWGGPEAGTGTSLQKAFVHPGVVITAANGDDGWDGWDFAAYDQQSDNMPSFPAASPYVVAVGGTTITPDAQGRRSEETVWNSNGSPANAPPPQSSSGATGGGCSRYLPARAWQAHYPGYAANGCSGKRLATDIAVVGDPATGLSVYDSGWGRYGGTSLSAPVVAGMYALAGGSGGAAYPAGSLYVNANTLKKSTSLFDVVTGGNSFCGGDATQTCSDAVQSRTSLLGIGGTNNPNALYAGNVIDCSFPRSGEAVTTDPALNRQCNAAPGLDGPSGIGAPRGLGLFHDTSPGASITRPSSVRHGRSAAFRANVTPIRQAKLALVHWSWGDGSAQSSGSAPHHTFKKAGRYTVTMAAQDTLSQIVVRRVTVSVG